MNLPANPYLRWGPPLGLAIVCALVLTYRVFSLNVAPAGCKMVLEDLTCEIDDGDALKLLVEAPDDATLIVRQGRWPFSQALQRDPDVLVPRGWLLHVKPPSANSTLWVWDLRGWHTSAGRVRLRRFTREPLLREARARWEDNQADAAAARVLAVLAAPADQRTLAEAHYLLSRIRREQGRQDDETRELRAALGPAQKAGLLSLQLDILLGLKGPQHLADARALLAQRGDDLWRSLELRPWVALMQGWLAQAQGHPADALAFLTVGEEWAQRFDDDQMQLRMTEVRAHIYRLMARGPEAEREFQRFADRHHDPCSQGRALLGLGDLHLSALGTLGVADRAAAPDPRLLLRQALDLFRGPCDQKDYVQRALVHLARAELVLGEGAPDGGSAAAQGYLRELDKLGAPPQDMQVEWLDVQGQVALARGEIAAAAARFDALQSIAAQNVGEDVAAPPIRRLSGLARAAEQVYGPERQAVPTAEHFYQEALAQIDRRARDLPLGVARESFLGQYEPVVGRYLMWLHQRGRDADALSLLRRRRLAGLAEAVPLYLAAAAGQGRASAPPGPAWQAAQATYEERRLKLDEVAARMRDLPDAEAGLVGQERTRLILSADDALRGLLGAAGDSAADLALREPGPAEVLLACHPVQQGWLCFAADSAGVQTQIVAQIDHRGASRFAIDPQRQRSELAAALLEPFHQKLQRARVVRVLGYGRMRQVDVHLLPFGGQPLGESRDVVYALDLPALGVKRLPDGGTDALGLFDPREDAQQTRRGAEQVLAHLQAAGFTAQRWPGGGRAALLHQGFTAAALFHYGGHGENVQGGELQTEAGVGLLAADVLSAERVPRWALLFGCRTGVSAEESGGLEGLGMAQAFLLRGSEQVLATVRPVGDGLAARLAEALYRQDGVRAGRVDLVAALRGALKELRAAPDQSGAGSEQDLGAFRVFVP